MRWACAFVTLLLLGMTGCANKPLPTVQHVDLPRYMGRWYEVARLPQWYEMNCVSNTADYTLRQDGKMDVANRCRKNTVDGPVQEVTGTARVADHKTNAKLKVRLGWNPSEGDYWILMLDEKEYRWAVVVTPDRRGAWILSRSPTLDRQTYDAAVAYLQQNGFDLEQMHLTPQAGVSY